MRKSTTVTLAVALLIGLTLIAINRRDSNLSANAAPASALPASTPVNSNNSKVLISEKDDGKTITVSQGTEVSVELTGNMTTGYSWNVSSVSGKAAKQNGDVAYTSDAGIALGRGGLFTTKFTTATIGDTTVKMEYKRPWEKKTAPAKTFSVTIKVVPAPKKP